jgi:two-component system chemotaxis response regulator CheB
VIVDGHDIVVIGTSAGGLQALDLLIGQLPTDIPASIFIVQHMGPDNSASVLLDLLSKQMGFDCKVAKNKEKIRLSRIYIAPPDYHLLVKEDHILVTKGARENRYRPGIDPLFRSAAAAHGPRVIGVLLTGMLDDGTVGLIAVKKCGGLTIVQDPKSAAYPEMPQSALNNLKVDYCVPITEMGVLLQKLVSKRPGKRKSIPEEIETEALIAERVLSDVVQVSGLGSQVPYSCPTCGGVLWEMKGDEPQRYRCHTGHSFTAAALLTIQTEKIEDTLWISLWMFEERKNLLNNMAARERGSGLKRSYSEKAEETQIHIERIRAILNSPPPTARKD